MDDTRNQHQIIRKDARNCFVESLNDAFAFGKVHLCFATYDTKLPAGKRQTNSVHIYLAVDEFLELCRKLSSGEMRHMVAQMKKSGEKAPLYKCLGGTSAEKLAKLGRARADGKSLSRTAELHCGKNADFLFVANSGPGETNKTGLIVPRFGSSPENHVAVSMTWDVFAGFMLTTKAHYEAWLAAWYAKQDGSAKPAPQPRQEPPARQPQESTLEPEYGVDSEDGSMPMF